MKEKLRAGIATAILSLISTMPAAASDRTIIKAGVLFDSQTDRVTLNAVILVEDEKNVAVGGHDTAILADVAIRNAINDGEIPGPRIAASGPSLGITGGHCGNNGKQFARAVRFGMTPTQAIMSATSLTA